MTSSVTLGPVMPRVTECPMHTVMRQLSEAVVLQHVLYAEGEFVPRANLTRAIDAWAQFHAFIQHRVCPASRQAAVVPSELEIALEAIFAELPETAKTPHLQIRLRDTLGVCAAQYQAAGCPLERAPDDTLME